MTSEIDRLKAHIDQFERALGELDDGCPRPAQILDWWIIRGSAARGVDAEKDPRDDEVEVLGDGSVQDGARRDPGLGREVSCRILLCSRRHLTSF